jgi:catechol 2,3-dioxygenase-like lactoylglutathione lyase family enzyme
MLADANINAVLAVKDLDEAKKFYGEALGLKQAKEDPGGVTYKSGTTTLYVYPSEFAGTNKATAAGWSVSDLKAVVEDLKSRGVVFEHYPDMEGVTLEGDIHVMDGAFKAVWFKDPSGNILAIDSGE